jgi:long-chain fatty acid transport protein
MFPSRSLFSRSAALSLLAALAAGLSAQAEIGFIVSGVGPVNRSMGGASVAAPIDAAGALYWNPGVISGLERTEMSFGLELVEPRERLSSTLPAGSIAPFTPPITLSGSTHGDTGISPLPTMALVFRPEQSDWTFGLGIFEIGGFTANYAASTTNPILTAQPPFGLGLGALEAMLQIFQLAPTASYRVSDHLSFGVAATVDMSYLTADPAFIASPDGSLGNGFPTFGSTTHTHIAWGLGCQAGVYYTTDTCFNLGASIKSPQWNEPFRYNTQTQIGAPRIIKFHFDVPMIASIGASYTGFERWVLAADFRYVDFGNAQGLHRSGFDATGAVAGLGWQSTFAMGVGAQYKVTDCLSTRIGYTFNTNPISNAQSSFNLVSATIVEHSLAVGFSYQIVNNLDLSVTYAHDFENSINGPIISVRGPIPGSSVGSTISADALLIGASLKF